MKFASDGISLTVASVQPKGSSRRAARLFLTAALLIGIYMTRAKIQPNNLNHGNNSTIVMLFTMTCRRFSLLSLARQSNESTWIAVGISFVISLSPAPGRTVQVLVVCRATHTVMKVFCTTQHQLRHLSAAMLFLWLISSLPLTNKSVNYWLKTWAVSAQVELLTTIYCFFVSLPILLQSILTKLNILSILFNMQLIAFVQNIRIPAKYILIVKISRVF